MYTKKQRTAAFLICAALAFVMLFFTFFVIEEANHDCAGGDCPICACIHNAEQTLRQLGTGLAEYAHFAVIAFLAAAMLSLSFFFVPCASLVKCKIRMNN